MGYLYCRFMVWRTKCPLFLTALRRSSTNSFGIHDFTDTLKLPQTDFPLSMKNGIVPARELEIQKKSKFEDLYRWQSQQRSNEKVFVLHDGPPYANGEPHVGHALNKILKDVTNRYKLLRGYRIHYVPGWDCHGLPIEQKALASSKGDFKTLKPLDIRANAKVFAESAAQKQLSAFKRWAVMADWVDGCYYTIDKRYETVQLETFFKMYEKGYVYQDYMPVFWSPSSRTALAEAEIEYNDSYKSMAVFVKYPMKQIPDKSLASTVSGTIPYVVIWTTTPWTLPLNRAICYGRNLYYCFVQDESKNSYLVLAEFKDRLSQVLGQHLNVLSAFEGSALRGTTYSSSTGACDELPLLDANHVTAAKGTGLVHTAPAHGVEDFQVAVKHGLSLECFVDEDGLYMDGAGSHLKGKHVLSDGTDTVLEQMADQVMHREEFLHSYPHDWRSKQPLIIRASQQWFINTNQLREKSLECLNAVNIVPKFSSSGMLSQLNLRSYWCISRQRVWGVPIPVFYEKSTKKPLLTRASIDHLKSLVSEFGTDCWWTLPMSKLLPTDVISKSGFDSAAEFERRNDILDIWFDSGVSWSTVLEATGNQADVYLEGLDQFGGWFQSSLLTSVAVQDIAPYRSLVVHGFVLDEKGKKMSKSLGNVVDPAVVTDGGKNKKTDPAYGVDVLRLWVAHSGIESRVQIGPDILSSCNERLFKIRKTLRYLMGNLHDFSWKSDHVSYNQLHLTDQFTLHLLHEFVTQATDAYEAFNYSRVVNLMDRFIASHMSGFHAHITKDRMYCGYGEERRSCQTVQYLLLEAITKLCAPILPHLSEEVVQFHPLNAVYESIFKSGWFAADATWLQPVLAEQFNTALMLRDAVNGFLGTQKPTDFNLSIVCDEPLFSWLHALQEEQTSSHSALSETFQCATVALTNQSHASVNSNEKHFSIDGLLNIRDGSSLEVKYQLVLSPARGHSCPRCRRKISASDSCLCTRCTRVLSSV